MRSNRFLLVILAAIALLAGLLVLSGGAPIAGFAADDIARGGYLAVIAAVLGVGVLARARLDLGATARAALFWIAGFVVLIGLYAYRAELREVGDRIVAALVPGHAISVAGARGPAEMVMRADDGHFHVTAEVNGERVRFLVDTGASMMALDRATARRLGFDADGIAFTMVVQTANGTARAAPVMLDRVRIGGIERRNVRAAVMDGGGDGIALLGMSFLGTLSSVEFRDGRLILAD
ncbi:aspartic protease [Aureimonas endophytica]|uniref:Aspartic protease n=1 Tax=Aureimonas endophytica TaxID=2027858 RepID=A0A917E0T9_9HYPH|nr:TIGR02281 family clan AA aspartic protease [Aureimonas endophytica]GGD86694.1 aspartic protease [Aureimonas endophytica]